MKFLILLSLLALTAADEEKLQDKKTQQLDTTQNTSSQTQPTLLNGQVFPPSSFPVFGTSDISNLAYTGFNGNISPIQTVTPDFFVAPATNVANGAIPAFTRAVLPGTSAVVNGIQSAFPATSNAFPVVAAVPAAVNAVSAQFPAGILPPVGPVAGVLDASAVGANGAIAPNTAYRFLTPEALTNLPAQGLQAAQQVGLAAIPAFTSGILPSLTNLQGQNIPTSIQQVLKNPSTNPTGVSNVPGLSTGNISSGPLTSVFRHA